MRTTLAIAVGGAVGTMARYGLGTWIQRATATFPLSTLVINVTGSFLLGFLMRWMLSTTASPDLRAALTIGFCGGYTTFSTYSYETATLLEDGQYGRAGTYALASVVLALVATFAGFVLARELIALRERI